MFKDIIDNIKSNRGKNDLRPFKKAVENINEIKLDKVEDKTILSKSLELKDKARMGTSLDVLMVEAFALVEEASRRVLKLDAYDEQMMAGMAMHDGNLIEMQTGEGKTLAAVFPAYLNSLTGRGVHILTFNDYLARRDALWMGPVFRFLGLTAGFIQQGMNCLDRQKAYACDITYVTAKEAGFDYLRDYTAYKKGNLVHRGFNYAIVDEADSIMIDEARIPLVIASGAEVPQNGLIRALEVIRKLTVGIHYETDEYGQHVYLTEEGVDHIEKELGCNNLYAPENQRLLMEISNALYAEVLLEKDVDYIVRDKKVEQIDTFTGRIANNRHWPDELQAAIEAKEGIETKSKGCIMRQITLQNYISLYEKAAGMTATARDSAEEFRSFYNLGIIAIPPHKPCMRKDYEDLVFTHKEAKYRALTKEVLRVHSAGRPVLIGTASVKESVYLAGELKKADVACSVLNAKNDELEAKIISNAGSIGAVTVSTNMAGRGTDIKLGGPDEKDRQRVADLGGLYVIGTNRHESRRIDKQLRGRAGRQGDPGSSVFFVSLEDDLIKKYGIDNIAPKRLKKEEQEGPIDDKRLRKRIAQVQRIIEGKNYDLRMALWNYSFILERQMMEFHKKRMEILTDGLRYNILLKEPMLYKELVLGLGGDMLHRLEKQSILYNMDSCFAEYLAQVLIIREGIHLTSLGGRDPLEEYNMEISNAFKEMQKEIEKGVLSDFKYIKDMKDGGDYIKSRIKHSSATWTYLLNDNSFADSLGLTLLRKSNIGLAAMGIAFAWPAILGRLIYERFFKKSKK